MGEMEDDQTGLLQTGADVSAVTDESAPQFTLASNESRDLPVKIIEPPHGWHLVNFGELWRHRELLYFLTWREVKSRYKQTALGALWAVLVPLLNMLIFTVLFGRLARLPSDGLPYPIFVYAGLLPWTLFANGVSTAGTSLVNNARMLTKVYFPRLMIPASAVTAGLVDFAISSLILGVLMVYYGVYPGIAVLLLPVLIALTVALALAFGAALSALTVVWRDFRHALPFLMQIWFFVTPVIYPRRGFVTGNWHWVMVLNPMAGIIDAYRYCLLGRPTDWSPVSLLFSALATVVLLAAALVYFRRAEIDFADIV
jgi:lipopolysaccharide transport system permease protein